MNPIFFAMKHPITTLMMVVALLAGGTLALSRMRVDIFPPLNSPSIYVFLQYGGMSPAQMEGLITNQFELLFQYVDGVKQIQSSSIQQVALVKLDFFPGTDMGQAMAQVVSMGNRAMSRMPPGTLPPMIMRMDMGTVPVGYLVMRSTRTPIGIVGDLGQNLVRPLVQKYVPGTVTVSPFGPNSRTILVNADPDKLRSYNLSPQDVVDALMTGNVIVPAGNLYIKDEMPLVPSNALVNSISEIGKIPVKLGSNVYVRDVATIQDGTDVNYGYALVNGKKSVYLPIVKKDTASTLTVVADIHKALPSITAAVQANGHEDVEVTYEFDESPTVIASIKSVATEGLIGAGLTGLMILIFLGDLRSVVVVVLNIPLALMGSLFGLFATGQTINIMSLGGLALAIGMLVDEATVSIENIHVQMTKTKRLARAVERGSNQTAVPRLLAMLCILSVFIPAFIMTDPLRSLFMPLALAVGFAMISSYILSSTLVPVVSVWLLKHHGHHADGHEHKKTPFERVEEAFEKVVGVIVRFRWAVVTAYLLVCGVVLWQVGGRLGTELFPQVDSGEFVLRFRPAPGTNFEITRLMGVKCIEVAAEEAKAINGRDDNIAISMGYVGQVAPNYGMNNLVLFMRGPDDGQLRFAFREGAKVPLDEFRERMRKALPQKVGAYMVEVLKEHGLSDADARAKAALCTYGFEPGDLVSEVMSFGSPTPVEIVVASPSLPDARRYAELIMAELKKNPFLRDLQYKQELEYPTVQVNIDREKAGLSNVNTQQVGNAVIVATSSSRFIALNYWQDPRTGFDYQVEVLVPTRRMTSSSQVETLPLADVNAVTNLMVRDVARVEEGSTPGHIDRLSSQRFVSITANVEGEDLGRASRQVLQVLNTLDPPKGTPRAAVVDHRKVGTKFNPHEPQPPVPGGGAPEYPNGSQPLKPKSVTVTTRGQLAPMIEMFEALGFGLAIAVFVILVMLTAYFESPRLAIISVSAVPGVLAGVCVMLYSTGTTLNIESFMGTIMCIGVSVSNSVMLVTFTNERWRGGMPTNKAAVVGAASRLRPILMTACAMTVGMIPMALALEEGSQMQAPLGRAVIGGLVCSTFATLGILPAVFAVVIGDRKPGSPSVNPDDPESAHHDPDGMHDHPHGHGGHDAAAHPAPEGGH